MKSKLRSVIIGIIIIIFLYNLVNQIVSTLRSGDRLSEATQKLHELEIENKKLKKRLEEVKTNEFLEREARNKLGLTEEDETLIIIPDQKIEEILNPKKEDAETRLPNWQGWLRVFWH